MNTLAPHLQQFRQDVHGCFTQRADSALDLLDALTQTPHVDSPVALSESTAFRRAFSSVYDVLQHGTLDVAQLRQTLSQAQPRACESIAGHEVYAADATPHARPQAETLPDRVQWKTDPDAPTQVGHRYSWLVRLVQPHTSWVAPQAVERISSQSSDSQVARAQVLDLDQHSANLKVVVADSLYGNAIFLAVFLLVKTVVALVRLRHNKTLYEAPPPRQPGQRGASRKHGAKFKLSQPTRAPDQSETHAWGLLSLRVRAWQGLHLKALWQLVGTVVCLEFLKADGQPLFKRPIWLFWTGALSVPLLALCQMYFWRFGIEHFFRFLKQQLGLTASLSTCLHNADLWVWLCALAYWQLLLMRGAVSDLRPAWHPHPQAGDVKPLTPGQVQRAAGRFLRQLGTPAAAPRPAIKGRGRATGYRPAPRTRPAVVKKSHSRVQQR